VKRLAFWVGIGAATLAALILAGVLALPYFLDLPKVQALAAANASQALGRPVRFASVSVRLLPMPRVELHGLEVAEDSRFGTEPFVTLERGFLSLRLRPLLGGRLEFGELRFVRPQIRLVEGPDGRYNVESLGVVKAAAASLPASAVGREAPAKGAAAGTPLLAAGIAVEKGTVSFVSRAAGQGEYRLVDLDLRLGGAGHGLTMVGSGTVTPGNVALRLVDGALGLGGVRVLGDAPVSGRLVFESDDLGLLVATGAPSAFGLSGRVRGALSLGGVLASPHASGPVLIPQALIRHRSLRCRPPERTLAIEDVSMTARWAERTLLGRPLQAKVGGGTVTATVTATFDQGLHVVVGDLSTRGFPLAPILVDFLCDGYAVAGPLDLSASLTIRTPDALQASSGEGRFSIGRGRVVGPSALRLFHDVVRTVELAASAAGEERPSPFEFESITGTYRLRDGVVSTRDLLYTGRGFTVTASGDYALSTDGLTVDLVLRHRREQMRARVTGTAAAPVLRVDILGTLREVESRKIERGLHDLLRRFR
jgi:uncharacterized protein involved in outer membrane biogenesis